MKRALGELAMARMPPNYPLNAQVPTTKLKTEITSEPSKITQ